MIQDAPPLSSIPRIGGDTGFRHRAFLEALADGDARSTEWLVARAGLLALRYIDAWASGEWLPVQLLAERSAVTDAITELPRGDQFRGLLAELLERTATEWGVSASGDPYALPPSIGRIASPLLAYAHALHFASKWAMAADVYVTVWEACGPHEVPVSRGHADSESASTAALRLGFCYRMLGESERAATAYSAAIAVAQERGDVRTVLRARLGEARLVVERGNLPLAEARLAEIIRDASTYQLQDIRAMAFHDRSDVAVRREQFQPAVEWAFEAWALEQDPHERERVLADLANALLGAGYVDLARAANRLLAVTTRQPYMRWAVTVNLLEIATIDRDEAEFERLRHSLRSVMLPPALLAGYYYYAGQGSAVFGQEERARVDLERAIALSEEHGLGEILIKSEAALARVAGGQRVSPSHRPIPVPPKFAHITDALQGAFTAGLVEAGSMA